MNKEQYYDHHFKPLRNQLSKFSSLELINYCIGKLADSKEGIIPGRGCLPWNLFCIIVWAIHFSDDISRKKITAKDFDKIYNLTNELHQPNFQPENFKSEFGIWWELRKSFYNQMQYQTHHENIGIAFLQRIKSKMPSKAQVIIDFSIVTCLTFNLEKKYSSINKELLSNIFPEDNLDIAWKFFKLDQSDFKQIAEESKKKYKTVYFERNSLTLFYKYPFFINTKGNIQAFNLPLLRTFILRGLIERLLDEKEFDRQILEDEFEKLLIEYINSYSNSEDIRRPNSGADLILTKNKHIAFFEMKTATFHKLLPQFPTRNAYLSSLKNSIVKGYKQILKSYRQNSKTKSVGFIITYDNLMLGDSQTCWEMFATYIFQDEELTDTEKAFLENYVWVIDYVEFVRIFHANNTPEKIFNFLTLIKNQPPKDKKAFLADYLDINVVPINKYNLLGKLFEEYFTQVKTSITN